MPTTEEILAILRERLRKDFRFESGRVLSSMCSLPHPLARQVYTEWMDTNLGDPGLIPGIQALETEALDILSSWLGQPQAKGKIVSGGSEANIMALWAARETSASGKTEVILPATYHFSLKKACEILGLEVKFLPRDLPPGTWDPQVWNRLLSKKTLAVVGIAGTTGLGIVDPLEDMSLWALENNLYLHVDAAFGGFVLPFLEAAGYKGYPFDFHLPGVRSITLDPHKMGQGPIPTGCLLFRREEDLHAITRKVKYLSGGAALNASLTGTRPGASAAALWALLQHLGFEGYTESVTRVMEMTHQARKELLKIPGLELVMDPPPMNILGFRIRGRNMDEVAHSMRQKGWALSVWDDYLRIVLMPHLKWEVLVQFFRELGQHLEKPN